MLHPCSFTPFNPLSILALDFLPPFFHIFLFLFSPSPSFLPVRSKIALPSCHARSTSDFGHAVLPFCHNFRKCLTGLPKFRYQVSPAVVSTTNSPTTGPTPISACSCRIGASKVQTATSPREVRDVAPSLKGIIPSQSANTRAIKEKKEKRCKSLKPEKAFSNGFSRQHLQHVT